jgi:hypothetical protein
MPKALTIEEKQQRVMEKYEERMNNDAPKQGSGGRKARSVFNGTKGKLSVAKNIPGYHLHIFNDAPGRIQQALNDGYEFVQPEEVGGVGDNVVSRNTDIGDKVRFLVGTDASGEPLYAYLMKIKQEWYEEDQVELQKRNDMTDAAIKRGKIASTDSSNFYDAGINFKN